MNKLDDFLKSKVENVVPESSSGWDALSTALPAKTSKWGIAKISLALLLLGGFVTTAIVLSKPKATATIEQVSKPIVNQSDRSNGGPVSNVTEATPAFSPSVNPPSTQPTGVNSNKGPILNEPNASGGTVVPPAADAGSVSTTDIVPVAEAEKTVESEVVATVAPSPETDVAESKPAKPAKPAPTVRREKSRADFHKGKLYVNASFSSVFSYRSFQLNNGSAPFVNKHYDEIRQNSEAMNLGYGATLALEYKFAKSFSLQGGLSYNKIGYKTNYDFEVYDQPETDNTGRIIGYNNLSSPLSVSAKGNTRIDVLRIPLGINYNIIMKENMLFHFYAGAARNFIVAASGTTINQLDLTERKISRSDYYRTANELCFDLGVNIAMTPKYGFGIDLYYNKWLTNISRNTYENITPFSPGINFAISRKLF
jgi:hypothetical protein